jgi:hypothetical protein
LGQVRGTVSYDLTDLFFAELPSLHGFRSAGVALGGRDVPVLVAGFTGYWRWCQFLGSVNRRMK